MKVLCNWTGSGPHYVRSGWKRVFEALGHEFRFWEVGTKPAFDVFAEYEPDLYIGTTYETDRAISKCIKARPHLKVCMFGSAWSPFIDSVDKTKYPLVACSEQEKRTLEDLRNTTSQPMFVFIHASGEYLEQTMSGWRSIGIEPVGILNAADIFVYHPKCTKPELACDVAFVGGYWAYKANSGLNEYILPLCHSDSNLSVKIFSQSSWPVAQHLGTITDENVSHLFSSAKVCPNVSEPHSRDFGFDIVERPFKILSSLSFGVSDYVEEIRNHFSETELVMARSPKDFRELIHHFCENQHLRNSYITSGAIKVLKYHTYHDRVSKMLKLFNFDEDVSKIEKLKIDFIRKHYNQAIVNGVTK